MPSHRRSPHPPADTRWIALAGVLILCAFWAGFRLGKDSMVPPRPAVVSPKKVAAPLPAAPVPAFPRGSGTIAIVLDDWGYSLNQLSPLASLQRPVTVAILPNLPYSTQVAQAAHARGHEVILHMPMEAKSSTAPKEAGTILTTMSRQEILKLLSNSFQSVPFAKGISNHQGSKATANSQVMETVLGEIKRRNLYFLDSLVTQDSVCGQIAGRMNLKFARRAVFLDNEEDPAAIQAGLLQLAKIASQKGAAVGIGHDRANTLQVLQETIPALERAGYTLVPVSKLADAGS